MFLFFRQEFKINPWKVIITIIWCGFLISLWIGFIIWVVYFLWSQIIQKVL